MTNMNIELTNHHIARKSGVLHLLGDCHAAAAGTNILNMRTFSVGGQAGGATLKRVGHMEDVIVPNCVKTMELNPSDTLIFGFGEIDVRAYVKPNLERLNITTDILLGNWASQYVHRIETLNCSGAKLGIMSVIPPTPAVLAWQTENSEEPLNGSDEERLQYTLTLNKLLKEACETRNWIYVDVYSVYADNNGLMNLLLKDFAIHIGDSRKFAELLEEMKLLNSTKVNYNKEVHPLSLNQSDGWQAPLPGYGVTLVQYPRWLQREYYPRDEMLKEVREILLAEIIEDGDTQKLTNDTLLISSGFVDSFSMVNLTRLLELKYNLRIPENAVTIHTYNSINNIVDLIQRLKNPVYEEFDGYYRASL